MKIDLTTGTWQDNPGCPINITLVSTSDVGLPLHVMSTSSSLNTVMPVLVKTDMVPSLEVLPTLINNVGKFWKVSACLACADSLWTGSRVTC